MSVSPTELMPQFIVKNGKPYLTWQEPNGVVYFRAPREVKPAELGESEKNN